MLKMAGFDLLNDDYEHVILERLKSDYGKKELEGETYYEVTLQDQLFSCSYSDEEMQGIIGTSIDIIKELISIQDAGYTRERFDEVNDANTNDDSFLKPIYAIYQDMHTPRLFELICKMAEYTRVGGAYFMIISSPILINAIYCVFDKMLDDFDDEDMWFSCIYFLIRGAMKMHSQDLNRG